jgi:hypothetical protein
MRGVKTWRAILQFAHEKLEGDIMSKQNAQKTARHCNFFDAPANTHKHTAHELHGRLSISRGWGPRDVTAVAQQTISQGVSFVGSCSGLFSLLQNIIFFPASRSKERITGRSNAESECAGANRRDNEVGWFGWNARARAPHAAGLIFDACMRTSTVLTPKLPQSWQNNTAHAPHFRTPRCQRQQLHGVMT